MYTEKYVHDIPFNTTFKSHMQFNFKYIIHMTYIMVEKLNSSYREFYFKSSEFKVSLL